MESNQYPQIEQLRKAVRNHNITLTAEPVDEDLQKLYWRRVKLTFFANKISLIIPVDDECQDVDKGNQLVMFHLVVDTCEAYEEAEDFLVWCKDNGLDTASVSAGNIYYELKEVIPKVREIIGPDIQAISSWDFQMNTDVAQVLRKSIL